jgi:hypothetical protein
VAEKRGGLGGGLPAGETTLRVERRDGLGADQGPGGGGGQRRLTGDFEPRGLELAEAHADGRPLWSFSVAAQLDEAGEGQVPALLGLQKTRALGRFHLEAIRAALADGQRKERPSVGASASARADSGDRRITATVARPQRASTAAGGTNFERSGRRDMADLGR